MVTKGFAKGLQLAFEREWARKDKDYARADQVREELNDIKVTIDDKQHMFTTESGLCGYYILSRGVSFREVQLICMDREEARKAKNYNESDSIREQLSELQVNVDDKTKVFTMPDGQQGSYDLHGVEPIPFEPPYPDGYDIARDQPVRSDQLFSGGQQQQLPVAHQPQGFAVAQGQWVDAQTHPAPTTAQGGQAGTGDRFSGYFQALTLAIEREKFRKQLDYQTAAQIRQQMSGLSVEVNDKTKTFTFGGSLEGTFDLAIGVTAHEVQMIALEREEARRGKAFERGDRLRDWIEGLGIHMEDKTHSFRMPDGYTGSYDLYGWQPVRPVLGQAAAAFDGGDQKRRRRSH